MSLKESLSARSENLCELCGAADSLNPFDVYPHSDGQIDQSVLICDLCKDQIETIDQRDFDHWHCLKDSMWTPVPAVQVMVWRILARLSIETWASELRDMMYLEEDVLVWAKQGFGATQNHQINHIDSNGVVLSAGDTVVLIKDLTVKGAGFTAKRGTAVRNISLDPNNENHIEGRVEGQHIVILTEFVKKK